MTLTREEKVKRAAPGVKQFFLKLAMLELSRPAVEPFIELADSLGLPERSVPSEEEKRLFFEFTCLGISVIHVRSREYLMTDSVFSPKFDPELHKEFMAATYRASGLQLDAHGISQLRERRPQGKRNVDTLQYRDGKPLSGSYLEERCDDYVRRMMRVIERGEEDFAPAGDDEFVFQLTELIDARLTNRNEPVVRPLKPIAQQITAIAIDLVDNELFAE